MWSYQGECLDVIEGHKVWTLWVLGGACQLSGGCQLNSYSHFYFFLAYQGRNIWSVAVNYDQTLVVSWLLEQHMQLNDHGHMVVPPAKVCAAVNPHPPNYCPTPRPQEEGIAVFA